MQFSNFKTFLSSHFSDLLMFSPAKYNLSQIMLLRLLRLIKTVEIQLLEKFSAITKVLSNQKIEMKNSDQNCLTYVFITFLG